MMSHCSTSLLVLCLLAMVALSPAIDLSVVRSDTYFRHSKVTLLCLLNGERDLGITFWRKLSEDGAEEKFRPEPMTGGDELVFELTPRNEGFIFCRNGGDMMSNVEEIVAFPLQDPVVKAIPRYSVPIGSDVELECVYNEIGDLSNRYRIEWYRGLDPLLNLENALPDRYTLGANNSLVISDTTVEDASAAYYCAINIDNPRGDDFYQLGPNVKLEVYDRLEITGLPSDVVLLPRGNASFTCSVSGSPEATIKWLFEGVEHSQLPSGLRARLLVSTDGDETAGELTTTSTLDAYYLQSTESGRVTCVAYHMLEGDLQMVSAAANLVVLPNDFDVELHAQLGGSAQIRATLPSRIPVAFSLVVRYIGSTTVDVKLADESFANTQQIVYEIPEGQLPGFQTFRVQLALQMGNSQGPFTQASNPITAFSQGSTPSSGTTPPSGTTPSSLSSDCPPQMEPSNDDKSVQSTLLIAFIVLIVLGIVVAVGITLLCIWHMSRQAQLKRRAQATSNVEIREDFTDNNEGEGRSRSHSSASGRSSRSSRGSAYSSSRSPSPLRSISRSRSRTPSDSGSETDSEQEEPFSEDHTSLGGASADSQELAEREKRKYRGKGDQEEFLVPELTSEDVRNMTKGTPSWTKRRSKELPEDPDIGYEMPPLSATNPRFHA